MILGALIDAGLDAGDLRRALEGLGLDGYTLQVEQVHRGAFECTRLRVVLENEEGSHGHDHSHGHPSPHAPPDPADDPTHRSLSKILDLLAQSTLPAAVKTRAEAIFRRLGEAEAKVHGIDVESVHFHEVGAVDSIVDIVGCCVALEILGIDAVHSEPVTVGTGFVDGAHGRMTLPAPATAELLQGFEVRHRDSGFELMTPTGAAVLTTLAESFGTMPDGRVESIGYGAGNDRPGPVPNMLRVLIARTTTSGESAGTGKARDRVLLLETNIDDMSGEGIGHLTERLFACGALDVWVTPIGMKKSRPGQMVSILGPLESEKELADVLFRESTTFGIRRSEVDRLVLERELCDVETPWGTVRVKVGKRDGEEVSASPEYEDVRKAAEVSGLAVIEVQRQVLDLYHREG